MAEPTRVLLVDDDRQELDLLKGLLALQREEKYALDWIGTYDEALELMERGVHDIHLVDYRLLADRNGLDLIREARSRGVQAPMILLTGLRDTAVDREAIRSGAADYLVKGQFTHDMLARALRYAVERKRLETMFVQAEKLSAMGFMAAGIAHELNNPLTIILGACELLRGGKPRPAKLGEQLDMIERSAERCRELVGGLLSFSRKDEAPPRPFELNACVASALALVEVQARYKSVRVVRELHAAPLHLLGRRNQIEQIVVNLANNAVDAMPQGGRLVVRTSSHGGAGAPCARLDVADSGHGIPANVRERIFEPFFTTKAAGRGTGLGLSLVQQIAEAHGGRIEVASEPGKGSTFSVFFPRRSAPR